jgi:AraC-like DNA-binding protein
MSCTFGLSETAVEVKVGQNVIAYLQTGQIFFKPPTALQIDRALKQIKTWGLDLDLDEVARRYVETPVVQRREYQATMRLLQYFADQLGVLANQIVLRQQTAEPAQITRARKFIEEQHHEKLSLAAVACHAGMSMFSFCKMFKKVTGLNFTIYLSRFRVEKAKNLLLNHNYRVSEIGHEVGFQSMTHFSRVFRKFAGESPTEYRQRLPLTPTIQWAKSLNPSST